MRIATLRFFLLLSLLLAGALSPTAWAHARVLKTEPAKDAEVSPAPTRADLWFNELLEDGFNVVTVFPAAELAAAQRSNLTAGKPQVDPKDRTHLSVKLGPLAPGAYFLEWRVLSRDGHSAPGRIAFQVRAGR